MNADRDNRSDDQPPLSGAGRDRRSERERRLAAQLRENLKKRKAQSRGRTVADQKSDDASEGDDRQD
jgi:hypothetical protein